MNLSKSYEFFKPEMCQGRIHIIGCGSVGSTVAELLARYGLTEFSLYDFDTVEPHNIVNQMFTSEDIGREKVRAVADMICRVNPDAGEHLKLYPQGYKSQKLSGYVFLCVDSIDLRREIATANKLNPYIAAMFDFRTRLTDAQHYAADWTNQKAKEAFLSSMDFTHEEAVAETPVSACGVSLSVAATVRMISTLGVINFVEFVRKGEIHNMILMDGLNVDVIG